MINKKLISTSKKSLKEEKTEEAAPAAILASVSSEVLPEVKGEVVVDATSVEKVSDAIIGDIDATLIQPLPTLELQLSNVESPKKQSPEEASKPVHSILSKDDELCEEYLVIFNFVFCSQCCLIISDLSVYQGWNNVLFSSKRGTKRLRLEHAYRKKE